MKRSPVILVTPSTEGKGAEFSDASVSVSNRYTDALIAGGALPQIFPATTSRTVIAEAVQRCDGVLLTGGDDIDPQLYDPKMPAELAKLADPIEPERDIWEKVMIDEAMAQKKPIFGVCRGIQILNVALGGTLFVDIATQLPNTLKHRQMSRQKRTGPRYRGGARFVAGPVDRPADIRRQQHPPSGAGQTGAAVAGGGEKCRRRRRGRRTQGTGRPAVSADGAISSRTID